VSALLAFLRIAWPYLLAAGIGASAAHEFDRISYGHLQTSFARYKAQVADANEKAQKAAADALQAQINARLTTEARNSEIVSQLTAERDSVALDRDFARRLLAAAQTSRSGQMSAPGHQPPAPDPPGASGDRPLAQDLGDGAGECRDAIQRLAALQAELIPQLTRP
jgi:hypothetical protein